jgi:Tfp pilus assembly protein PilO
MSRLTPIIFILATILIGVYYIKPVYADITALQEKISERNDILAQAISVIEKRNKLESDLASIDEAKIARLDLLMPKKIDTVRLIIDIKDIAEMYGLEMRGVKVDDAKKVTTNTVPGQEGAPTPQDPFDVISLDMTIAGAYQNFIPFLSDIEQSIKILDLTKLDIITSAKVEENTYSVSLKTYRFAL